jgi:hypothetical protein
MISTVDIIQPQHGAKGKFCRAALRFLGSVPVPGRSLSRSRQTRRRKNVRRETPALPNPPGFAVAAQAAWCKVGRVTLLYANRKSVAAYKKEFDAMAKQNPNLTIHYLFSPQRIDKETVKEFVPDLKKPLFYVSGPEPMVESIGQMLQEIGIPKNRIKQDWFPGYPAE